MEVTIDGVASSYLSNGTIRGTITVKSAVDSDLHYTVQVLHSGLTPIGSPLTTIGRYPSPTQYEVKAFGKNVTPFTVRACEVLSDPCQGTIQASITVEEQDSVRSDVSKYTAYPDPSATFRDRDLTSGTTPLFVATRTTRHIVPVTTLVVALDDAHAVRAPTFPPELDASVELLKQRGIDGVVDRNVKGGDVSVTVVVPPGVDDSVLKAALQEIVQRYGDRIAATREYITQESCLMPDESASPIRPLRHTSMRFRSACHSGRRVRFL